MCIVSTSWNPFGPSISSFLPCRIVARLTRPTPKQPVSHHTLPSSNSSKNLGGGRDGQSRQITVTRRPQPRERRGPDTLNPSPSSTPNGAGRKQGTNINCLKSTTEGATSRKPREDERLARTRRDVTVYKTCYPKAAQTAIKRRYVKSGAPLGPITPWGCSRDTKTTEEC